MLAEARRVQILEKLSKKGSIEVNELSKFFQVTAETIRSDLEKLDNQNLLTRTHGGAVLLNNKHELSFDARKKQNVKEKQQIAEKAINYIKDGDTIFLDISSTVLCFAQKLNRFNNLTVITNSARVIWEMAEYQNITIISTGGLLKPNSFSYIGPNTNQIIQKYYADTFFASCKGISPEHGITDSNDLENQVKMSMLKRSQKTIILADHSKFNQIGLVQFALIKEIDLIISDDKLAKSMKEVYEKYRVKVY